MRYTKIYAIRSVHVLHSSGCRCRVSKLCENAPGRKSLAQEALRGRIPVASESAKRIPLFRGRIARTRASGVRERWPYKEREQDARASLSPLGR